MRSHSRNAAGAALALAIIAAIGWGAVEAQSAADASPATGNVEVDPIRCWWRTSAGAVRVGELFGVVLTCAVIENELNVVVPDQSRLEPAAMELPPFEVMGGTHFSDSHTTDRRFFQYEYRARLVQDNAFGKDTPLPSLEIKSQDTYRYAGRLVGRRTRADLHSAAHLRSHVVAGSRRRDGYPRRDERDIRRARRAGIPRESPPRRRRRVVQPGHGHGGAPSRPAPRAVPGPRVRHGN